jgi:hypothetical protein
MKKYFAEINPNNIVQRVVVAEKVEDIKLSNQENYLIECSKDGSIRKNGAAYGFTYDSNRDAFITPKPFNSWILNETTCKWEAPVSYPVTYNTSDKYPDFLRQPDIYKWDENIQNWVFVEF